MSDYQRNEYGLKEDRSEYARSERGKMAISLIEDLRRANKDIEAAITSIRSGSSSYESYIDRADAEIHAVKRSIPHKFL